MMLGLPAAARTAVPATSSKRGLTIFKSAVGRPSGSRLPVTSRTYADLAESLPDSAATSVNGVDSTQGAGPARPLFSPKEIRNLMPDMTEMGLHRGDHVTVAMSGGVDSSVALKILSEMPVNLSVVYMRNWDPQLSESEIERLAEAQAAQPRPKVPTLAYSAPQQLLSESGEAGVSPVRLGVPSVCQWEKEYADVRAVAKHVGIPDRLVQLVDFTKEYWNLVFEPSVSAWEHGRTPNPDVMCNREIKFGALMRWCEMQHREQKLATGHYARAVRARPHIRLCKAQDRTKDQSYYLSSLVEQQLRKTILPLGGIKKHQVRRLAKHWGLPTADKEESMGICFVGERQNFGGFVSQYMPTPPSQGYLVDSEGNRLAEHPGLWHYTVGQRAKLQGKTERWFVAKKGVGESGQDIRVVPGADHPALLCHSLTSGPFDWISGKIPASVKLDGKGKVCDVMIRHRMEAVKAKVMLLEDAKRCVIRFKEPLAGVAPGQVAAVYFGNWCLGSGVIETTRSVEDEMIVYEAEERKKQERKAALEKAREERRATRQAAADRAAAEAEDGWEASEAAGPEATKEPVKAVGV